MPFTRPDDRKKMDDYIHLNVKPTHIVPGDWCYVFYKRMVERWKADMRWTTAHTIYNEVCQSRDDVIKGNRTEEQRTAFELAWQVFFQLHVMPYELEKRGQHGDI